MNQLLSKDAIPLLRPHFQAKAGALYFLLSRRAHASLDDSEQAVWGAIDGRTPVADLSKRFPALDRVLERFVSLGVCEIPPVAFPSNRRRILVVEPHMDDAALSVGGTMWLRRNECEFTVLTLAGVSNFTSYYMLGRDFFDISQVSALRKAESALFLRHVGGRHMALDLLEAPLRYRHAHWTLDWFRQHREVVSEFLRRSPGPRELEEWTSALARALATFETQEIWMPLGVGLHVDHQLARDACLRILRDRPELVQGRQLRFYQDVPYSGDWPQHAGDLVAVLRNAGASLNEERVDIGNAMADKLRLLSIFGSQFKMTVMGRRVEKSAQMAATPSFKFGEALYEVVAPPSTAIEPWFCCFERHRISGLTERLVPWFRRHRLASSLSLFVPTPFARWAEDMQFLLEVFPRARFEVHMARSRLPEIVSLSSPRIRIRPVGSGRWSWYMAAGRLLLSKNPVVIVARQGKEHHAHWLRAGCFRADSMIAPSLNDFMLGMRLASKAEPCERGTTKRSPVDSGGTVPVPAFETKHTAFVLSLYDTGLVTARGLARHGIPVMGLDWDRRNPGFHSRLFPSAVCPPPHGNDDGELLDFLKQRASGMPQRPVLYPASDEFVGFIARNAEALAKHFLFQIPEPSVALGILGKHTQAELARKAGAIVPETALFTPDSIDQASSSKEYDAVIQNFPFPAFLKPVHGYQWKRHMRGKGVLVRSSRELVTVLQKVREFELEAILQEIIPGSPQAHFEVSLYVDTREQVFGPFIMRKWRQFPRELGTGTYGTSIACPVLAGLAQSIALKMGIRGFANMEFMRDPRDGLYKFIEVNPRVWQQVALAADCGLDLPLVQYLDLTQQSLPKPSAKYQAGVRWIDLPADFLASPSLSNSIRVWRSATSRGILAKDDPWPAIRALLMSRRFLGCCKGLLFKMLVPGR